MYFLLKNIQENINNLELKLKKYLLHNKSCIIMGIFNINKNKRVNNCYEKLENLLSSYGFIHELFDQQNDITFVGNNCSSSPDHIWTRNINCTAYVSNEDTMSDHYYRD